MRIPALLPLLVCLAGCATGARGTLAELRSWAHEGLHGVKWGALIMRISDRLQLLLQEVSTGCCCCRVRGPGLLKAGPLSICPRQASGTLSVQCQAACPAGKRQLPDYLFLHPDLFYACLLCCTLAAATKH